MNFVLDKCFGHESIEIILIFRSAKSLWVCLFWCDFALHDLHETFRRFVLSRQWVMQFFQPFPAHWSSKPLWRLAIMKKKFHRFAIQRILRFKFADCQCCGLHALTIHLCTVSLKLNCLSSQKGTVELSPLGEVPTHPTLQWNPRFLVGGIKTKRSFSSKTLVGIWNHFCDLPAV